MGPVPPSEFGGLGATSYANGVFTIDWAGADPDADSGTPAGSIAVVNVYVEVDGGVPTLVGQVNAGTPNANGVYSGSLTYGALGDGLAHSYSFFSVGVDDEQRRQYAPQTGPATPEATFANVTYSAPLAVQSFAVEQGIAERSFIQYLDVDFNQSVSSPGSALQNLAAGLSGSNRNAFVELLWYGEGLSASSVPKGTVNLFGSGTMATLGLSGDDLSINFGPNGITGLLTEAGVAGTGKPTTTFGDGWFALGIDPTGNPSNGQVFWLTFFRLLGDTNGDGVVTGPYTTAGTDAAAVYSAEGESGSLLNADVDGNGTVNSKDLSETVAAKGDAVGSVAPRNFPQFQLLAGPQGHSDAASLTQAEVAALLPRAIDAWVAAGLDPADVQALRGVRIEVGDLGSSLLGLEAAGLIEINRTAAGYGWYAGPGSAFGPANPAGESLAEPGGAAAGRVDLLTVLEHELGHVLGLGDDATAYDLMDITLGPGVRRSPSASDVAMVAPVTGGTLTVSSAALAASDHAKPSVRRAAPTIAAAPFASAGDPHAGSIAMVPGADDRPPFPKAATPAAIDAALASIADGGDDPAPTGLQTFFRGRPTAILADRSRTAGHSVPSPRLVSFFAAIGRPAQSGSPLRLPLGDRTAHFKAR